MRVSGLLDHVNDSFYLTCIMPSVTRSQGGGPRISITGPQALRSQSLDEWRAGQNNYSEPDSGVSCRKNIK
jgi:hypothetical protein